MRKVLYPMEYGLGGLGLAEEETAIFNYQWKYMSLKILKDRDYFWGELAKNTVAPGLLQFAAKSTKRGHNPLTRKRQDQQNR